MKKVKLEIKRHKLQAERSRSRRQAIFSLDPIKAQRAESIKGSFRSFGNMIL